ncbi:winged helix-turn-helix domain-containing protein [Halococcus salsus]|uniref:winged helix-turn-helix domain-containing protein n=1 Tax=Halococcus salsus TaxID=2162894 RepID=UPI001356C89F|nr:winged helix-turn-helix domain-containing protein [Halococcus salsus]
MGTITLSDEDEDILTQIQRGKNTVENIASATGFDSAILTQRLDQMAENDLVRGIRQEEYDLTESGQRVLNTSDDTKTNEEIDTPNTVEQDIAAFDLSIEREESVRRAFTSEVG